MAKTTPFSITLTIGDKTYTSKGDTALEALMNLKKPEKIVAKAIVTIRHGKLTKTQQFFPVRLKRLFYNKLFQAIQAKQLALGMK